MTNGLSAASIADKMGTTRQFVNQTKLTAEAKLSKTLLEVAQTNDLQVTRLLSKEGVLVGYHPVLKRRAILTYSTNHGIKIWYWYDNPEEVTDEEFLKRTRTYLLDIARERGLTIQEASNMHPARLANEIFGKLVPELKQ